MTHYANNTIQARVQSRAARARSQRRRSAVNSPPILRPSISAARQSWPYELQTLPRPTGRATHVVITEYDLPRQTIAPHDVRTDAEGHVWYSNFVENFLGELDPKTGEHREYPYSGAKPGFPDRIARPRADADGNLWLAMMFQTGLARFDIKTKTSGCFPFQPRARRRCHAAIDGDAARGGCGRQSMDQ